MVTEGCQGCLAHPCVEVCPKGAITLDRYNGRSHIDQDKCIKCGRCIDVCAYHAIIKQERPCAAACGMDAGDVSVKATTEEGLGFTGEGLGIAAHCVCLLRRTGGGR